MIYAKQTNHNKMNKKTVRLKKGKEESLRRFHPWVFSGAIASLSEPIEEGEIVRVCNNSGDFIAIGHFQLGSIAVRILSFEDIEIDKEFLLDWTNLNNTRRRMDWLEVSDLLVALGNRKWGLSEDGKKALDEWSIVSPEVVSNTDIEKRNVQILAPSTEIQELLKVLVDNPELHKKRNTYNMWMPSPNRIENLKKITQFAFDSVSRSELFEYIENEFNLKVSSVESMMPFLKADGLIEEVGRNIYVATPAAKAWGELSSQVQRL